MPIFSDLLWSLFSRHRKTNLTRRVNTENTVRHYSRDRANNINYNNNNLKQSLNLLEKLNQVIIHAYLIIFFFFRLKNKIHWYYSYRIYKYIYFLYFLFNFLKKKVILIQK